MINVPFAVSKIAQVLKVVFGLKFEKAAATHPLDMDPQD